MTISSVPWRIPVREAYLKSSLEIEPSPTMAFASILLGSNNCANLDLKTEGLLQIFKISIDPHKVYMVYMIYIDTCMLHQMKMCSCINTYLGLILSMGGFEVGKCPCIAQFLKTSTHQKGTSRDSGH